MKVVYLSSLAACFWVTAASRLFRRSADFLPSRARAAGKKKTQG
jgi:hypothetical protein